MPNAVPPRDRAENQSNVERLDTLRKHCVVCGQSFDTRDQNHVFHHDGKAHEPLSTNDK